MFEIIYTSAARRLFDAAQLSGLLNVARANNDRLGVSGILLYEQGSFIQVLEGEEAVVRGLLATIAGDPRHGRITVLRKRPIAARSFAQWTMGFVALDVQLLRDLPLRHGLGSNGSLVDAAADAVAVLDAFRQGRWRGYILG